MKKVVLVAPAVLAISPTPALAWDSEGHVLVAAIARSRLNPEILAKVDAILAQDLDSSTPSDMLTRAVWADIYRRDHRETSHWHFADARWIIPILTRRALRIRQARNPPAPDPKKPAQSTVSPTSRAFGDPNTPIAERILALKFVLHFVGDMHQPLHVADNHDHGGNCTLISRGCSRTVNLHSYWDTVVVGELGKDARQIPTRLSAEITPDKVAAWSKGDSNVGA